MNTKRIIPSYGRKRCRGLSINQSFALNELYDLYGIKLDCQINKNVIDDKPAIKIFPKDFFQQQFSHIIVEIGFGMGEHLLANAQKNKDIAFIGCEPFENGVATAINGLSENNINNVKVYNGDARILIDLFPDASIDRFYVLFPDPWRKTKHSKRRLLSCEFLKILHSKLSAGGMLIMATDNDNYMKNILNNLNDVVDLYSYDVSMENIQKRPNCFIETRYEGKAIQKNKECYYIRCYKNFHFSEKKE